jgi:hypothetical protein
MNERNVHHADETTSREDLKHSDTIAADPSLGADPAGYEQSINPLGEVPPAADGVDLPADEDAPIANRVGRDPNNLGDDVPNDADLVHPAPINAPVGKMPGM